MFDYDKWQEIVHTINKNKLRTFLTALGVFWGIFMLIILMGAGTGLKNGVFAQFGSIANNTVVVWTSRTTLPYEGFQTGRRITLSMEDIHLIRQEMENEIEYLAPRMSISNRKVIHKQNKGMFDIRGDTPDILKIDALALDKGRFLNQLDLDEKRKVVVIGKRVKEELFKGEEAIGAYLKIQGIDYLVVGLFKSSRSGELGEEDEKAIFLPLTTAQQMTNQLNKISYFACTIRPPYSSKKIEKQIKLVLKERHRIHPNDSRGINSNNVEEQVQKLLGLFSGIKGMSWFVGLGSLLFGVIGVGNIMVIIVKDRTKEIGIRKAIGATPKSIINMILLESVFITTLAGYAGLLTSIGLLYVTKIVVGSELNMFRNPEIDLTIGLGALLILVIAGAITGLIPAMQAANINPVSALKDE